MPSGTDAETDYLMEHDPETVGQMTRSGMLSRVERRHRIIALRRMGLTYEQIAEAMAKDAENPDEIHPAQARRIVHTYLEKMAAEDRESVAQLRELENQRLDDLQKKLAPKLAQAQVGAINAALKIMERRSKLNGLDAPERKLVGTLSANVGDIADPEQVKRIEAAFHESFGAHDIPEPEVIDVEDAVEVDGDSASGTDDSG